MQPETISIIVDGAPLAKGRGKIGKLANGRPTIFTPSATRQNENRIKQVASDAMQGRNPFDGPVEVEVVAFVKIPKSFSQKKRQQAITGQLRPVTKPDCDNFLKSALDGCNSIVFEDDKQAVDVYVSKRFGLKPRLEIRVTPLDLTSDVQGASCGSLL